MTGRRWLPIALAVGAALVLPAAAGAQVPTQDSASGEGPFLHFAITSGPSGENPTGFFSAEAFGTHFEMTSVTCLAVNGNTATFVGPILPNAIFSQGGNIKLTVVDNGPAGTDTLASSGQVPPYDCLSPLPQPGSVVLADIVVEDAPPLPTTKAQCMGDGWQAYGVFKNEGDCVSFVATGGTNPPAGM